MQIHLTGLAAHHRRDPHLRVAAAAFDALGKKLLAQPFLMGNADLLVLYKVAAQDEMDEALARLRFLFSTDPMIIKDARDGSLCTWYDLEKDYDALTALAGRMLAAEQARRRAEHDQAGLEARAREKAGGTPFTPDLLARVEAELGRADLSNLIRRQAVCAIVGQTPPRPVLHELFISIVDLRQTLFPQVDLGSSPWLFQQLTETLDRRVLSVLNRHEDRTVEGDISLNLNVSTLLSSDFMVFDDNVKASMRGSIVLELQKVDIFADLGAYLFARDFAHERGYRVCIDGLSPSMLPFVDRERLGADLVKLIWEPSLVMETDRNTDALGRIGVTRIILAHCDTPSAIEYGQAAGVTLFQGRHVEQMLHDMRHHGIGRTRPRP